MPATAKTGPQANKNAGNSAIRNDRGICVGQATTARTTIAATAALAVLGGCMGDDMGVTRAANSLFGGGDAPIAMAPTAALDAQMEDGTESVIITKLMTRRSVLANGPLRQVTAQVLAANSRAAEADLRAATLRAEAQQSNWLPTLGPNISLSSMGALVASMVVEQVIYDNGRNKAERDFARADVEVAAVALAQDTNARVLAALELYLTAQAARARAAVAATGTDRMERFEYVMVERVRGGVSDRADLQVVQQKLTQIRNDMASDLEAANAALSELGAMSQGALGGISGVSPIAAAQTDAISLTIMKAEAESTRAVAEAVAARAGFLPGVTASGAIGGNGGAGLSVGAPNGLGFGTGASLRAIEAQRTAAAARVGQVREDANRAIAALEGQLGSLRRQDIQARNIAAQAAANYDLFEQQLSAGQRTVPSVVGIFETKIRAEREAVALPFDIARIELKLAALRGALVDGDQI